MASKVLMVPVVLAILTRLFVMFAMKETHYFTVPSQAGKLIVVTGANSGLGLSTAKILAADEAGADVIMACRSMQRCEAARSSIAKEGSAAHMRLHCHELDLTSFASIRSFVQVIEDKYLHVQDSTQPRRYIDTLVNNAGIMAVPEGATEDGFELQVGTNHLGHFLLTGLCIPHMHSEKKSSPAAVGSGSRVVMHSSIAAIAGGDFPTDYQWKRAKASGSYSPWKEYGHSKRANLYMAWELQSRLRTSGSSIDVVAAHPGYTSTNLQRDVIPGWEFQNWAFAMESDAGAQSQLLAATTTDSQYFLSSDGSGDPILIGPKFAGFGSASRWGVGLYTLWEAEGERLSKQKKLWEDSVRLTGVMGDL